MGRRHRTENYVRRLNAFLFGFVVTLLALPMAAATDFLPRGQPIPQNIRVVGTNATGVNASLTTTFLNATGNTTHHKVPVSINSSTLGKLANAALKKVGPAATLYQTIKGVLDGVGWFIDEAQQQVTTPGVPQQPLGEVVYCVRLVGTQNKCAAAPGQLLSVVRAEMNTSNWDLPCTVGSATANGAMRYRCIFKPTNLPNDIVTENRVVRPGTTWPSNYENHGEYVAPATIPHYDLGQLLKQYPHIINAILIDPETGAPYRTQEVTDALNDLRRALEAANGVTTPQPDLGVDTGWEDGETTPNETDWPGFCDWATTVCDAIEWFRSPDDEYEKPEVPWEELPVEQQEWSSGIGGGTCPAPVTFTVSVGGVSVSPQFEMKPVCDFATLMRPLVIAIATLIAVYIVAGLRQSKDA